MNKYIYLLSAMLLAPVAAAEQSLNIYSFRQAELIAPLVEKFEQQHNIDVNVVSGKADKIMSRLIEDGDDSFADLLLTSNVLRLERAKKENLIQAVESKTLTDVIPKELRDPEGYWFGLSVRARTIFYAKDRVNPKLVNSYQDLSDPKWQGKICTRKGSHLYNQSLLASFIHRYGQAWSDQWVKSIVGNLALRPAGGDRDQLRNISRGVCDLAIVNSYYYGMLSSSDSLRDKQAYEDVGILWPNQTKGGTHVNISAAAVTRAAKNKQAAITFIEFLVESEIQMIYADINYEYPVRADLTPNAMLTKWGDFIADKASVTQLHNHQQAAKGLIEKYNW
ncbi:extracellular solute-binding protein [Catenovulum sp. SM1970]|uniref:extracellular solute-binding protein n=1 Tax=Marinifaba aquimaris TaxID=2741323 RepID=UPI001571B830|nr:extracellular solute-binding protein [Marinifaba aquimaris]NTS77502.1 extracellular solute-binding protein [Marinifaba aquimaris]